MRWNKSDGYIARVTAETTLKNFLGISTLDYYVDSEENFIPYYTYVMEYINEKLVILGETDIKLRLDEVMRIMNYGAEKIASDATRDLVRALGIETDIVEEDADNIVFNQDRFVFAWTGFMTSLWMRLKFQYANLFVEPINNECCKCGARGDTTSDYESWSSKVFPQDEVYDRSNFERTRSTTAWGTRAKRYCDCYRK